MRIAPPKWLMNWILGALIEQGKAALRLQAQRLEIRYGGGEVTARLSEGLPGIPVITRPGAVGTKTLEMAVGSDGGQRVRLFVFLVKD